MAADRCLSTLHIACDVKYCITEKIDIIAWTESLESLVSSALKPADINRVEILLKRWAEIELCRNDWLNALMLASAKWEINNVELLLEYWAEIFTENNNWKRALDFAREYKNYDIIDLLEREEESMK